MYKFSLELQQIIEKKLGYLLAIGIIFIVFILFLIGCFTTLVSFPKNKSAVFHELILSETEDFSTIISDSSYLIVIEIQSDIEKYLSYVDHIQLNFNSLKYTFDVTSYEPVSNNFYRLTALYDNAQEPKSRNILDLNTFKTSISATLKVSGYSLNRYIAEKVDDKPFAFKHFDY